MSRVYAFTVTRAASPERARLLLETITRGRDTAAYNFDWHLHANGGRLGHDIADSCLATRLLTGYTWSEENEGQHPPFNRALHTALGGGYDYFVRIDDDVEWLTKRWLAKLVEASQKLKDKVILSPQVKGLRWQPPQSQTVEVEGVPLKFIDGPIGGICRLHPLSLLREKPYVSDVRLPMGGGDAGGIYKWALQPPITPLAYCQHIRIRHAKSTDQQEADDPLHFQMHDIFQHVPYAPHLETL